MKVKTIILRQMKEMLSHLILNQRGFREGVVDSRLCYTEGSLFAVGPFKKQIRGPETARLCLPSSLRQILDDIFTTRSEEPTSS